VEPSTGFQVSLWAPDAFVSRTLAVKKVVAAVLTTFTMVVSIHRLVLLSLLVRPKTKIHTAAMG
jgi:hypothetical protein